MSITFALAIAKREKVGSINSHLKQNTFINQDKKKGNIL